MGIYDRDYYRGGGGGLRGIARQSLIAQLMIINLVVWIIQILFDDSWGLTRNYLACSANDLFAGFPQVWRLVTANFTHDPETIWHLAGNMLGLFIFGRELEGIYGRRDFLILYLVSGALAIFAEAVIQSQSNPAVPIMGASGSILAIVILYATFFPHRIFLLFFFLPVPIWLICVFLVVADVFGMLNPDSHTAHSAHLAGAAFGFAYRHFDLRWERVMGRVARLLWKRRKPKAIGPKVNRRTRPVPSAAEERIAERIDQILAKIHQDGMGSISDEEREFLLQNSKRYRSG